MKTQYWVTLLFVLLLLSVVGAGSFRRARHASQAEQDFFSLREKVRETLLERVAAPPEGVAATQPSPEKLQSLTAEAARSEKEHIQGVLHGAQWFGLSPFPGHDWNSTSSIQLLLQLNDSAFPQRSTVNSETMTATTLLEHYFGGMSDLGFRSGGPISAITGQIQSASNEWFIDGNRSIVISGAVFVAKDSKEAIVLGTVREQYPR